jgi:hypothetical protein
LSSLLERWGFLDYGVKKTDSGIEQVLVKQMKSYNNSLSVKQNFPNIKYSGKKFFLPIERRYHTDLLPDSILLNENQIEFIEKDAHRYALQKVYISFSYKRDMKPGDLILFYRKGEYGRARYTGVVTTLGVIDSVQYEFATKKEFFNECQNRSIFTDNELENIWRKYRGKILLVKFLYLKNFKKKVVLNYLWEKDIVTEGGGPRSFDLISDSNYDLIMNVSEIEVKTYC